MNNDLNIIKKLYGEKMMHLCRELFPSLLEQNGLLSNLIIQNFAPTKFLYYDIIDEYKDEAFKNYIYSLIDVENPKIINNKSPRELLKEAGYILYECKTESDIQKFKKYYKFGEELCTFKGGRLERCYVFFAIKENVAEIIRENFKEPKREDIYGTSVISIQFSRGTTNTLSIKNRYNHKVNHPDATFSNNLENIIEGLTESFEREYNLHINQNNNTVTGFNLPGYVKANDKKFYKYNYEINNIYYCPNNIIIDNFEVKKYDQERYIVLDYFIIDLSNKTIELYDKSIDDCFTDGIKNIKKINIIKYKDTKNKQIKIETDFKDRIIIDINKLNQIISYKNHQLTEIGYGFLYYNEELISIETPNLQNIESDFLHKNEEIAQINLPKLKKVGDNFLLGNNNLIQIDLPNLEKIGGNFLYWNTKISQVNLPKLKEVGDNFLGYNHNLIQIDLPNLEKVGGDFLYRNKKIGQVNLPKLKEVGHNFLEQNDNLIQINLPNLEKVGGNFLCYNKKVTQINLPNLRSAGYSFLYCNEKIIQVNLPKLKKVGDGFLGHNGNLIQIDLPNLEEAGSDFLWINEVLTSINLPNLRNLRNNFLYYNDELTELNLPNLEEVGDDFLYVNTKLSNLSLPNLRKVGSGFLTNNNEITNLYLPSLEYISERFFKNSDKLNYLYVPKLNRACKKQFLKHFKNIVKTNEIFEIPINEVKKSNNFISQLIKKSINFNGEIIKKMKSQLGGSHKK